MAFEVVRTVMKKEVVIIDEVNKEEARARGHNLREGRIMHREDQEVVSVDEVNDYA